jgi:hypothetical protein
MPGLIRTSHNLLCPISCLPLEALNWSRCVLPLALLFNSAATQSLDTEVALSLGVLVSSNLQFCADFMCKLSHFLIYLFKSRDTALVIHTLSNKFHSWGWNFTAAHIQKLLKTNDNYASNYDWIGFFLLWMIIHIIFQKFLLRRETELLHERGVCNILLPSIRQCLQRCSTPYGTSLLYSPALLLWIAATSLRREDRSTWEVPPSSIIGYPLIKEPSEVH